MDRRWPPKGGIDRKGEGGRIAVVSSLVSLSGGPQAAVDSESVAPLSRQQKTKQQRNRARTVSSAGPLSTSLGLSSSNLVAVWEWLVAALTWHVSF